MGIYESRGTIRTSPLTQEIRKREWTFRNEEGYKVGKAVVKPLRDQVLRRVTLRTPVKPPPRLVWFTLYSTRLPHPKPLALSSLVGDNQVKSPVRVEGVP